MSRYKGTMHCRPIRNSIVLGLVLLLAACQGEQPWMTSNITGAMPDLSFSLTDANHNKPVTAEEYQGKVVMLFFGFTHCPNVCPTTLLQLQKALSMMGEQAKQVQVLFVTVDPERDSQQALKRYTENFGSQTIGLYGDAEQLEQLAKTYGVSKERQQVDTGGNYDISHGSAVYVFDHTGTIRLLVRANDPVEAIASDLKRLVAEQD